MRLKFRQKLGGPSSDPPARDPDLFPANMSDPTSPMNSTSVAAFDWGDGEGTTVTADSTEGSSSIEGGAGETMPLMGRPWRGPVKENKGPAFQGSRGRDDEPPPSETETKSSIPRAFWDLPSVPGAGTSEGWDRFNEDSNAATDGTGGTPLHFSVIASLGGEAVTIDPRSSLEQRRLEMEELRRRRQVQCLRSGLIEGAYLRLPEKARRTWIWGKWHGQQ